MPDACPVCDSPVEHRRVEGTDGAPVASFDVDDLCSVADDTRWDRICTVATTGEGGPTPALELYYHFFEE